MDSPILVADASTLLNFLKVQRFDLLAGLGYRVTIVDAVYDEVVTEREPLDLLVNEEAIGLLTLQGEALTETVAQLLSFGLGQGEAFTFAAAIEYKGSIAIDDRRAVKRAMPLATGLTVLTTVDIVVANIHANRISLEEADALKAQWSENHRFHLKFDSFSQMLGETPNLIN